MPEDRKILPVGGLRWTKAAISYSRKAFKWTKGNHKTDEAPINGLMGWPWNPSKLRGVFTWRKSGRHFIYRPVFVWKDFLLHFFSCETNHSTDDQKASYANQLLGNVIPQLFPYATLPLYRCNRHSEPRTQKQKQPKKRNGIRVKHHIRKMGFRLVINGVPTRVKTTL